MKIQIQGNLMKIYLEEPKREDLVIVQKALEFSQNLEWIVLDFENIEEFDDSGIILGILCECTANIQAEVIAIHANDALMPILFASFIDVSSMFHYIPDSSDITLICEGKDREFVHQMFQEFAEQQDIGDIEVEKILEKNASRLENTEGMVAIYYSLEKEEFEVREII